jgi:1-acyl-sn-glycerol-3-phosphate acyltransferase
MVNNLDFESIRPYKDEEIHMVFERLKKEESFLQLIHFLYPDFSTEAFLKKLMEINSIKEFQFEVIYPYLKQVLKATTKGITQEGLTDLDPSKSYLFISNHRDIVLDSAILNLLLVENGFDTCEIAIGDNLLIFPWITDLVKLNKTFIVQRNLPVRQMMESSTRLSAYIRHTLTERQQSIWIAQREGRTKNGDDRTQVSLLKMLNISGSGSLIENFKSLNIVPVSISYELDPCDYLKAHEFQLKKENPDYVKTQKDDLNHMGAGLKGRKGRVHFTFGTPLNGSVEELSRFDNKNDQIQGLAEMIDQQIHANYKLWPCNFISHDLLNSGQNENKHYSSKEKQEFEQYVNEHLGRIHGDQTFLRNSLLEMYANPVINSSNL